jgi:hypothetical protein
VRWLSACIKLDKTLKGIVNRTVPLTELRGDFVAQNLSAHPGKKLNT